MKRPPLKPLSKKAREERRPWPPLEDRVDAISDPHPSSIAGRAAKVKRVAPTCPECNTPLTCPCCAQVRRGRSGWTEKRRAKVRKNGKKGGRPRVYFAKVPFCCHETDREKAAELVAAGWVPITKKDAVDLFGFK